MSGGKNHTTTRGYILPVSCQLSRHWVSAPSHVGSLPPCTHVQATCSPGTCPARASSPSSKACSATPGPDAETPATPGPRSAASGKHEHPSGFREAGTGRRSRRTTGWSYKEIGVRRVRLTRESLPPSVSTAVLGVAEQPLTSERPFVSWSVFCRWRFWLRVTCLAGCPCRCRD